MNHTDPNSKTAKMALKNDVSITDIGGSRIDMTLGHQLPLAFQALGDFPKEVAYTAGMEKWFEIAGASYQTAHELEIIERTAHHVVSDMSDGTTIIDLGAANSTKYEAYVRAFLGQGKTCTYVALDIEHKSLAEQIRRAQNKFPEIQCFGLLGQFRGRRPVLQANLWSPPVPLPWLHLLQRPRRHVRRPMQRVPPTHGPR